MKKNYLILVVSCILILGLILGGCDDFYRYRGSYVDLYTEAVNSLFDTAYVLGLRIVVMDEDNFGRTMYFYSSVSDMASDSVYSDEYIWAVFICQKKDDQYVYYYSDYNFIVRKQPDLSDIGYLNDNQLVEKVREVISDEEIEKLKEKNDWEKPIDESKCIKTKLVRRKRDITEELVPRNVLQEVYNKMCTYSYPKIEHFFSYLTSDDYGRHIYFFRTADADNKYTNSYVVMFNPDDSYDIAEILDLWNYQDELKAFKEKNNWNEPM